MWQEIWPTLSSRLVDSVLPADVVNSLAAATCTEDLKIEYEVFRRVLLAKVKDEEARLNEEQKQNGKTEAVDEIVARRGHRSGCRVATGNTRVMQISSRNS
jgi:uncharacterized phage-like protein YoqJ